MTESNTTTAVEDERMHALVVGVADDLIARCLDKGVPPNCVVSGVITSAVGAMSARFGADMAAAALEHIAARLRSASALMAAEPAGHA